MLEATTTKTGEYLLRVQSDAQVAKLSRLKKLTNKQKVKCEIHPMRNSCRCVITHPAITGMSDEKLTRELKPQGVTEVRGIKPSNRLKIVTLKGTSVPNQIKIGLLTVRTLPYYPMVKICRNCWMVGHITTECQGTARCGNCSGVYPTEGCKLDPFCGNCGESHTPAAKHCLLVVQEKAIIKMQVDQDI